MIPYPAYEQCRLLRNTKQPLDWKNSPSVSLKCEFRLEGCFEQQGSEKAILQERLFFHVCSLLQVGNIEIY